MKGNENAREEEGKNEGPSSDLDPGSAETIRKTLAGVDPLFFGPYALYFETKAFLNPEAYIDFRDS
jgi:hypothetical protein